MTNRDERLEAVAQAWAANAWPNMPWSNINEAFREEARRNASSQLAVHDAIRAFDEQRKPYCGDCPTPNECKFGKCMKGKTVPAATPVGADPHIRWMAEHPTNAGMVGRGPPVLPPSPIGADPPWRDKIADLITQHTNGAASCIQAASAAAAIVAFAAAQPPSEMKIDDAANALTEVLVAWLPAPLHRMAYTDGARAVLSGQEFRSSTISGSMGASGRTAESEVMPNEHPGSGSPPGNNATAPAVTPAGADPPWLDEACKIAFEAFHEPFRKPYPDPDDWVHTVVRAVLAFFAAQPPSEREIEKSAAILWEEIITDGRVRFSELNSMDRMKTKGQTNAILIAAAKARAGG